MNETQTKAIAEAVKQGLSGIPDAAKAEPYSYLILGAVVLMSIVTGALMLYFSWRSHRDFLGHLEGKDKAHDDLTEKVIENSNRLAKSGEQCAAGAVACASALKACNERFKSA